ncbi:MAG: DNA-directed RNA polymerase subunit alpha [Candidatus Walczuchella monophlebidarum]
MTIVNIIQPERVLIKSETLYSGIFEINPLEPGFGVTIGNSLRRILLSSLEGFAITSVKIEGVNHEFSTIKGVIEDVTDIILNCKKIRLKKSSDLKSTKEEVTVCIKDKEKITAGDFGSFISGFQVLNPDLIICNKNKSIPFNIFFIIEKGRGYVPAEANKKSESPIGTIAIDSIFTPIKNVKYTVENCRFEPKTDYEKLSIEIQTDGSISPKEALIEASKILINHFMLFNENNISTESPNLTELSESTVYFEKLLNSNLSELGLSVRAQNCLKSAEIFTLRQLISKTETDLKKLKHFGIKTLNEINIFLEKKGLGRVKK